MADLPFAVPPTLTYLPPPVLELPEALVSGALVLPGRDAIVNLLPKGRVMLEVGVALGTFSRYALDVADPSLFIAVDLFRLHEMDLFWGRKPSEYFGDMSHADWYRATFSSEVSSGKMLILEGDSAAVLEQLDDDSIDIVYVDADHRYDYVRRELGILNQKVRQDGYIIIDDYILVECLNSNNLVGVIYATHEFMIEHGWAMHYMALQTNTYYQVVLRRLDQPRPAFQRVNELERETAMLRREVESLRASTSWQVTAPLRALGRLSGRGRSSA